MGLTDDGFHGGVLLRNKITLRGGIEKLECNNNPFLES